MFSQNIDSLKKSNKTLADCLVDVSFDEAREYVSILKSKSDDIIFMKDGIPLESTDNPIEEAFYDVQSCLKNSMGKFDFIIIFGLGVGYLLDYVFEKYESRIVLIEPDINVMRTAFEIVDYSKYLESGRLFMTTSYKDVYNYISQKYIINDKIEIVFLKRYLQLYADEIRDFTEKIYDTCSLKIADINTIKKNSQSWVYSSINFVKNCGQTYPISLLDNEFDGKTALIVGAGPSLKDNIDLIKKYSDRFIIFAVNRSLDCLFEHNVIPNFGVFTDSNYITHTFNTNNPRLIDMNYIIDIKSDPEVYNLPKKRCFVYYPNNFDLSVKISEINKYVKLYEMAGTSTISAFNCAKNLGCKNIILCGVDLAFKGDIPYSTESYKGHITIEKDKVKTATTEKNLIFVKSVTGENVKTREDYAIFIKQFEKFIKENPQLKVYNITSFGALINGCENNSLNDIMARLETPFDNTTTEDIINKTLYDSPYNPVELKKETKEIINSEEQKIFDIRANISSLLEKDIEDGMFYVSSYTIMDKISSTIFLSQIMQFEMLKCTKLISQENTVQKRASIEMFLEDTLKVIDNLSNKLAKI
ncbi:motility associated factor glycosyltransferase family protein [bacterium]|nr:motility associated factor glycosyltransferase family protein [bacterium]